jgi:hypothetical protein
MVSSASYRGRKNAARKRGIPFKLKRAELIQLLSNLDGSPCQACRKPLDKSRPNSRRYPSLDRIDPRKEYCWDNITILCRGCNSLKSAIEYDIVEFESLSTSHQQTAEWMATLAIVQDIMSAYR